MHRPLCSFIHMQSYSLRCVKRFGCLKSDFSFWSNFLNFSSLCSFYSLLGLQRLVIKVNNINYKISSTWNSLGRSPQSIRFSVHSLACWLCYKSRGEPPLGEKTWGGEKKNKKVRKWEGESRERCLREKTEETIGMWYHTWREKKTREWKKRN